ncbi:MAG: ATP synthase F0 subunit B [Proteobacteria bacterium]|nr:ATP synthase F0 subunit B [Pseudomonadota bacterium]
MFVRNEKQYIWPFIVIAVSVLSFVPWVMNKFDKSLALTVVPEAVSDYLLFVWLPTLGNVLIVAMLIIWFGGPAITDMLKARKETIEKSIDEAAHVKMEAEVKYREAETNMDNLGSELKDLRDSYAMALESERERITEETARQAQRIEQDAEVVFELQSQVATRQFERDVMTQALDKARTEIVEKLSSDPGLRDRLIDRGIASLDLSA